MCRFYFLSGKARFSLTDCLLASLLSHWLCAEKGRRREGEGASLGDGNLEAEGFQGKRGDSMFISLSNASLLRVRALMTTSFLRFRMRVLSNKGHGSSCFSSFAPVASFYLLLSSLLPSSPRRFPSPPRSHTHTHTHTHTRAPRSKPFLPPPSDPVLCCFPLLGRLLSRRDFHTHYIAA